MSALGHDRPHAVEGEAWGELLRLAAMAPSSHNTQPWRFRRCHGAIEVLVDRSRHLAVVDPDERELMMSCGAAVGHLEAAIRGLGREPVTDVLPGRDGNVVATVSFGPAREPSVADRRRVAAIARRHTNRARFSTRPVPAAIRQGLQACAAVEAAELQLVTDGATRGRIADLVATGTRIQHRDSRFRRELARWMRPAGAPAVDGLTAGALGLRGLTGRVAPTLVARLNLGRRQAAVDRAFVAGGPVLGVLATQGDAPAHWVAAGRALSAVLLDACAEGLSVSYFNQPVQVPWLRPRLREAAGSSGHLQILLRLGYGPEAAAAPRRPVAELLEPPAAP
jgi:hypothetical protein